MAQYCAPACGQCEEFFRHHMFQNKVRNLIESRHIDYPIFSHRISLLEKVVPPKAEELRDNSDICASLPEQSNGKTLKNTS